MTSMYGRTVFLSIVQHTNIMITYQNMNHAPNNSFDCLWHRIIQNFMNRYTSKWENLTKTTYTCQQSYSPRDVNNNGRYNIRETRTQTIAILSTHASLWHNLLALKWQAGVTTELSKIRWKKSLTYHLW